MPNEQIGKEKRKFGRSFWLSVIVMTVLIPATVGISWYMGDRKYYVASVLIMIYSMIPFFASFESRKPQAREIVTLAVMCAIAVASRAAFIWAQNFKPMGGIIVITAMAFGPQAGFMTGAFSMIVSNMIFGQGPWTPWQMFAFGFLGFISGLLAKTGILSEKKPLRNAVIGFIIMVAIVGPILDTCTIFTMAQMINVESIGTVYLAGLPLNVSQGVAVSLCILLLTKPMTEKLNRIKIKYGMMEE